MGINEHADNVAIMKTWIEECRHHIMCTMNLENFLPTRLLDLEAFGKNGDIRLVSADLISLTDEGFQPEYFTLSHCWGPPEKCPIKTTKGNLQARLARIALDDLSNTFRDAVRITRELGERFLWIDSLCIIQDDEDDWAKEAALMAQVYGQSYCTLAALSSHDSSQGCCVKSDIQNIGEFCEFDAEDENYGPNRIRIFADQPREWHTEYGDNPYRHRGYGSTLAPLRSRAWTLQERELAIRTISFGKDQLLWECRELKASAQLPWHHKTPEDDFEMWPIRDTLTESIAPGGPVTSRDRWYELMEDFSFRSLTVETDKLPALSGLARQYQYTFPDGKYLAGMWSLHLPAALLWRSEDPNMGRYSSYIAPTWSWASIRGRISYESQRLDSSTRDIEERYQERPSDCDFGNLKVEDMHGSFKYDDKFGAIKDAHLVLSGAAVAAIDCIPPIQQLESGYPSVAITRNGDSMGHFLPDAVEETLDGDRLFCLRIRGEPAEPAFPTDIRFGNLYEVEEVKAGDLVIGLVLKELGGEGKYRRIGLARWVKKSLFEGSHLSAISLF